MELRALIFDLDDTLVDTTGLLIPNAITETIDYLKKAGLNASEEDLKEKWNSLLKSQDSSEIIGKIIRDNLDIHEPHYPDLIINAKKKFYERDVKEPIEVINGVRPLLEYLKTKYDLYLVTAGSIKTQTQKIEKLRIANFFNKIFIADANLNETKLDCFKSIIKQFHYNPNQVLVIGNRYDSEIIAGKKIGSYTCLVNQGEQVIWQTAFPEAQPDFLVNSIIEIKTTCRL